MTRSIENKTNAIHLLVAFKPDYFLLVWNRLSLPAAVLKCFPRRFYNYITLAVYQSQSVQCLLVDIDSNLFNLFRQIYIN